MFDIEDESSRSLWSLEKALLYHGVASEQPHQRGCRYCVGLRQGCETLGLSCFARTARPSARTTATISLPSTVQNVPFILLPGGDEKHYNPEVKFTGAIADLWFKRNLPPRGIGAEAGELRREL